MRDTQQVAECAVTAQPSDMALFFTSGGLMYTTAVQDIPIADDLSAPGQPLDLSDIPPARFVAGVNVPAFDHAMDLLMLTRDGRIKRTVLSEFDSVRGNGLKAISLKPGDKLGWVQRIHSNQHAHAQHILVVSRQGKAIRFKASEISQVSRTAFGVGAIKLRAGDRVGGMDAFTPDRALVVLLITEQGYVNSIPLRTFNVQGRNGTGSYSFSRSMKRCGEIIAAHVASGRETLTMFSKKGEVLRVPVPEIPRESANSQGTELMPLGSKSGIHKADSVVMTIVSEG
jgi:DNA gyrase subunit A